MTERRYREGEVRRILELATRQPTTPASPAAADGLTLAEIQSIGSEVGVDAEAIAHAAASLESASLPRRRSFGMPIEVAHSIRIQRALTDEEWGQLVAELRSTFRATGRVTHHGTMREWSNGNLHVAHEPTAEGYRLRMGTMKGDALSLNLVGVAGMVTAAAMTGSLLMAGELQGAAMLLPAAIGASGIGAIIGNALRLPRWRERRQKQMRHIASRVQAMARMPAAENEKALEAGTEERPALGE